MILITGATGYVGIDLVKSLERKEDIRIISRQKFDNSSLDVVKGNVENKKIVKKAMKDIDYVIHLAAGSNHFADFSELYRTNVLGTKNIIEAAVQNNVKRVIHMSSMAAAMPLKTAYGETKRLAEEVVKNYWNEIDIPILRAPLIYDLERLERLRKIFLLPMTNKNFKVHLLYKKSLIDAIISALKKGKSQYYNIADKKSIRFHDFHKAVLNTKLKPIYMPHFLINFVIASSYIVKKSFNFIGLNSPITPEFIEHIFQDREFNIDHSVKKLEYKPVDTLKTIQSLLK